MPIIKLVCLVAADGGLGPKAPGCNICCLLNLSSRSQSKASFHINQERDSINKMGLVMWDVLFIVTVQLKQKKMNDLLLPLFFLSIRIFCHFKHKCNSEVSLPKLHYSTGGEGESSRNFN